MMSESLATAASRSSRRRSSPRRVAVTGLGLCTSTIRSVDGFRHALGGHPDAIGTARSVCDEELGVRFPYIKPKYLEETAKYALVAAAEALADAGLLPASGTPS